LIVIISQCFAVTEASALQPYL